MFLCNLCNGFGCLRNLFFVGDIFFDKLPTSNDGGGFTALFDIIVVEYQIDMHDSEEDKEPHQEVMDLPGHQVATHQRNCPGEQLREEGLAHFGI